MNCRCWKITRLKKPWMDLFKLVAREEKNIRDDPFGQGEQIIRRVFGSQKSDSRLGVGG